jgi:hypothetical protein
MENFSDSTPPPTITGVTRGRPSIARPDPRAETRRVTHCPRGHEYTLQNTYIHPTTLARICRACRHEASRKRFRQALYGLTFDQYQFLLARQGGRCAICGAVDNGGVALGVDHDHRTGVVRGLLCDKCNQALGALREDRKLFVAAIAYLEAEPPKLPSTDAALETFRCALCGAEISGKPRRKEIAGRTVPVCDACLAITDGRGVPTVGKLRLVI